MSQALPFVGAAVGFVVSGFNPVGAQIGWALGSVGSALLAPTQTSEGSRLQDLKVQSSTYGKPIPILFGEERLAGNVIWALPLKEVRTTERVGKNQKVVNYSYFGTAAIQICEGPIAGIRRIWADGELIYDASGNGSAITADGGYAMTGGVSGQLTNYITAYYGTEEQMPDPTMQAGLAGKPCPAHRGVAYVVVKDFPLADYGNRMPNFEFEPITSGTRADVVKKVSGVGGVAGNQIGAAYDKVRGKLWFSASSSWPTYDHIVLDVKTGLTQNVRVSDKASGGFRTSELIRYDEKTDTLWVVGTVGGVVRFAQVNPDTGAVYRYVIPKYQLGSPVAFCLDTTRGAIWYMGSTSTANGGQTIAITSINYLTNETFEVNSQTFATGGSVSSRNGNVNSMDYDEATDMVWAGFNIGGLTHAASLYPIQVFPAGGVSGQASLPTFDPTGVKTYPTTGDPWFIKEPASQAMWFYDGANLNRIDQFTGKVTLVSAGPFSGATADGAGNVFVAKKGTALNSITSLVVYDRNGVLGSKVVTNTNTLLRFGTDIFVDQSRSLFACGNSIIYPDRLTSSSVTVGQIFTSVAARLGIAAADLDVSAVTGTDYRVQGFGITTRTSARSALQPLMMAYALDVVDSGGKAKVSPRASATLAATIPLGDLAARIESGSNEYQPPLQIVKASDLELPSVVEIGFSNPELEYRADVRRAKKLAQASSVDIRAMSLPIVMNDQRATLISEMLLAEAHMARHTFELTVGLKYLALDPGDVIDVESTDNGVLRMLITKIQCSPSGLLKLNCQAFDYSVYQAITSVPAYVEVVSQPLKRATPSQLTLLDIPVLSSKDDGPGFYAAAYNPAPDAEFGNPALYSSSDGITYSFVAYFGQQATTARTFNALGNCASPEVWDTVNTLDVSVSTGALYSSTDFDVLNGANTVLVGGEVMQFVNARLTAPGVYTLSRLLRGRKGTEAAVGSHTAGEQVILLDGAVQRIPLPADLTGASRYYKLVSQNQAVADAKPVIFTNTDAGLMCYSPVKLTGSRTNGDLLLSWVRRARVANDLRDRVDVPLGEASEAYDVDILDGAGAVRRTVRVATPQLLYTSAQQVEDFGTVQASVPVQIYQISAAIGRGYALAGSI